MPVSSVSGMRLKSNIQQLATYSQGFLSMQKSGVLAKTFRFKCGFVSSSCNRKWGALHTLWVLDMCFYTHSVEWGVVPGHLPNYGWFDFYDEDMGSQSRKCRAVVETGAHLRLLNSPLISWKRFSRKFSCFSSAASIIATFLFSFSSRCSCSICISR